MVEPETEEVLQAIKHLPETQTLVCNVVNRCGTWNLNIKELRKIKRIGEQWIRDGGGRMLGTEEEISEWLAVWRDDMENVT